MHAALTYKLDTYLGVSMYFSISMTSSAKAFIASRLADSSWVLNSSASIAIRMPYRYEHLAVKILQTMADHRISNSLPEGVMCATSLLTFRPKIKNIFLSTILTGHYFVTVSFSSHSEPCSFLMDFAVFLILATINTLFLKKMQPFLYFFVQLSQKLTHFNNFGTQKS